MICKLFLGQDDVCIVLNPAIRMFRNEELSSGQALMSDLFRFLTLFSSSQPRCGERGPASPRPIAEGRLGGLTGPRCPHCTLGCQLTNNSSQLNGSYISMVHGSCPRHCAIAPNYRENMKTSNPAILVTITILLSTNFEVETEYIYRGIGIAVTNLYPGERSTVSVSSVTTNINCKKHKITRLIMISYVKCPIHLWRVDPIS